MLSGSHLILAKLAQRATLTADQQRKALRCIDVLEPMLATPPAPEHPLGAWFTPRLVQRLNALGVQNLSQLADLIEARGRQWYRDVPRVGPQRATRIVHWLMSIGHVAGNRLTPLAWKPRNQIGAHEREAMHALSGSLVPLERLNVVAGLDGSAGTNRGVRNRLASDNDLGAIHEWLRAKARNPNTFRAYRREAERMLLWSIVEMRKPLSSLTSADCSAYIDFLIDVGRTSGDRWRWTTTPEQWIGNRSTPRFSPGWRPFDGPLSVRSIRIATTILRALFEWLSRQRYLDSNPWDGVKLSVADHPGLKSEPLPRHKAQRALDEQAWRCLNEYLDTLDDDEPAHRKRFIVRFAYFTGMRLHELAAARFGMIRPVRASRPQTTTASASGGRTSDGARCSTMPMVIEFRGKGGKQRLVPLGRPAQSTLREYMLARNLGDDPLAPQLAQLRLIAPLTSSARRCQDEPADAEGPAHGEYAPGLSHNRIHRLVKDTMMEAARYADASGHAAAAKTLAAASVHWLRHSFATRTVAHMPLTHVQALMGHADINITSEYVAVDEAQLADAIGRAF